MENKKIVKEALPMELDKNIEVRSKKANSQILVKIAVFNVINLILVVSIVYLVGKMPSLGNELKEIRSATYAKEGVNDAAILRSEIEKNQDKIDPLKNLVVDDAGLFKFVQAINDIKNEGLIAEFTLTGQGSVRNSKKELGYPISFVFQGTKDQINAGLERLYALPVLFNISGAELEGTAEAAVYKLNIFLLIDE